MCFHRYFFPQAGSFQYFIAWMPWLLVNLLPHALSLSPSFYFIHCAYLSPPFSIYLSLSLSLSLSPSASLHFSSMLSLNSLTLFLPHSLTFMSLKILSPALPECFRNRFLFYYIALGLPCIRWRNTFSSGYGVWHESGIYVQTLGETAVIRLAFTRQGSWKPINVPKNRRYKKKTPDY